MGEAVARQFFASRGMDAQVSSCGLLASGYPAPEEAMSVMAERGIDMSGHSSRKMTPEIIARADLILGMERRHVREIVALVPDAFDKTFTLPEFAWRLEEVFDGGDIGAEPTLAEALEAIARKRTRRDLLGGSSKDEIDDPIGRSLRVFKRVAGEIEDSFARIADRLWPAEPREALTDGIPAPAAGSEPPPKPGVKGRRLRLQELRKRREATRAQRASAPRTSQLEEREGEDHR